MGFYFNEKYIYKYISSSEMSQEVIVKLHQAANFWNGDGNSSSIQMLIIITFFLGFPAAAAYAAYAGRGYAGYPGFGLPGGIAGYPTGNYF